MVEREKTTVQLNLAGPKGSARPRAMRAGARGRPGLTVELASAELSSVMPERRATGAVAT